MSSGLHFLLLPVDSLDASTRTARGLMIIRSLRRDCHSAVLLFYYRPFLPETSRFLRHRYKSIAPECGIQLAPHVVLLHQVMLFLFILSGVPG